MKPSATCPISLSPAYSSKTLRLFFSILNFVTILLKILSALSYINTAEWMPFVLSKAAVFFIGILIANKLNIPLFPVRKAGKLPAKTRAYSYDLEYGSATLEIHTGVVQPGWKVMIHDDLLATGGTAVAAAELVKAEGGDVAGFSFIAALDFLGGEQRIRQYSNNIVSAINFS